MVASTLFLLPLLALGALAGPPHAADQEHARLHRRRVTSSSSSRKTTTTIKTSTTLVTSTKKSTTTAASSKVVTLTSSSPSANAARAAPTLSCPASDTSIYAASNGENFKVQCNIDHTGGDLKMVYTSSLDQCISTCSTTNNCQAVSWVPGTPNGPCYMKSIILTGNANTRVWGAIIQSGSTSSTSSISSTTMVSHNSRVSILLV